MINKIKKIVSELRKNIKNIMDQQNISILLSQELEWAHIYHDSIRGKKGIETLPLNIGRWAGNYCFFYVLNRILSDYKPKNVLDLGLGESSKFISTYLDHYLHESKHVIVEQDENWVTSFSERFQLSERSKIIHCPLVDVEIKGNTSHSYSDFNNKILEKFDLYIVDGPFGSDRYSRYDIVSLVEKFNSNDEFIILMDDTHRQGEIDTKNDIISILKSSKINYYVNDYVGNKTLTIICSNHYKYSTSF
jgi:16S rRNA G966 N2-methylase RsmD